MDLNPNLDLVAKRLDIPGLDNFKSVMWCNIFLKPIFIFVFIFLILINSMLDEKFFPSLDPGWAVVNRGVLVCDECCGCHRGLGRHVSLLKSLKRSHWPPSQLQVIYIINDNYYLCLCNSDETANNMTKCILTDSHTESGAINSVLRYFHFNIVGMMEVAYILFYELKN